MGKKDRLTSTERLLRVIREGGEENPPADRERQPAVSRQAQPDPVPPKKPALRPAFSLRRKSTLGVLVGNETVRIVAMATDGSAPRIGHLWKLPLTTPQESSDFPAHLKKLLEEALGGPGNYNLWTFLPSSQIEIIHLRLPRVARKDIPNSVFWSLKREKGLNERERSFDFVVDGEITDKGIPKLSVVAVTFPKDLEDKTKALFSRIGYPLKGLTAQPFAVQNLLASGWLTFREKTISVLTIENHGTRIDIFQEDRLVLSREVRTGLGSMVDGFMSEFHSMMARTPGEDSAEKLSGPSGETLLTATQSKELLLGALGHPKGRMAGDIRQDFSDDDLFNLAVPALQRLARQIERTFTYNTQTMGQEAVSRVFVAGELATGSRLREYLSEQLGVKVDVLDAFGSRSQAIPLTTVPRELQEKVAFTPVVGLALSGSIHSPNLLHTYREKVRQRKAVVFQRLILAATFMAAIVLGGYFLWQSQVISTKQRELAAVESRLASYKPQIDKPMLFQLAGKIKGSQEELKRYATRYVGLAALTEIIRLTPESIELLKVTTELDKGPTQPGQHRGNLLLEGLVTGERSNFETQLASYLIRLRNSDILDDPEVHSRTIEGYAGVGEALHFIVYVNVV